MSTTEAEAFEMSIHNIVVLPTDEQRRILNIILRGKQINHTVMYGILITWHFLEKFINVAGLGNTYVFLDHIKHLHGKTIVSLGGLYFTLSDAECVKFDSMLVARERQMMYMVVFHNERRMMSFTRSDKISAAKLHEEIRDAMELHDKHQLPDLTPPDENLKYGYGSGIYELSVTYGDSIVLQDFAARDYEHHLEFHTQLVAKNKILRKYLTMHEVFEANGRKYMEVPFPRYLTSLGIPHKTDEQLKKEYVEEKNREIERITQKQADEQAKRRTAAEALFASIN